ncbi:MAG: histidine--tRNA ligase [Planctomycetota bacterium]
MPDRIQGPKGTNDLLPDASWRWQAVERVAREVARLYRYCEVRTPVFEDTALFHRGVGEATDIVTKETYTFESRGGDSLTLRPEGTAPVVRALLQAGLLDNQNATAKVFYLATPMLRYERPQAGRLRQHHQFGCEAFGIASPEQDVELISLQSDFYQRVGLRGVTLKLNTLGDGESKQRYAEALRDFFGPKREAISDESKRRLETNPLRILDSKDPRDVAAREGVPANADFLSDKSREHFDRVRRLLDDAGISYTLDDGLVRGLDYYTDTLWEFDGEGLGAQSAVGGGGRYDNLVQTLGGKTVPGVGFGMGMERLLLALEAQGVELPSDDRPPVYVVVQGDAARDAALALVRELRAADVAAECDLSGRGAKAQFKLADRSGAETVLVLGDRELENGVVGVKTMSTGEQRDVLRDSIVAQLRPASSST